VIQHIALFNGIDQFQYLIFDCELNKEGTELIVDDIKETKSE
jgi:hypothetical protein